MKGLCALKKERKEKVHSFTQRFAAYLKNFSETDKPLDKVLIEYYTSDLGPDLAMFAKMKSKPTVVETVARVFTLACADEHLLRNLESLVAVRLN